MTYTRGLDRSQRRGSQPADFAGHVALIVTSLASAIAIAVCYSGRMKAFDAADAGRASTAINLLNAPSPSMLEPAMALAFDQGADRRFAARELSRALAADSAAAGLTNVGAIGRIEIDAATIDGTRGLVRYAERLREARAQAAVARAPLPASLPLFTSSNLALLKPALVVRTTAAHRRTVFWCAVTLLLSFQMISVTWLVRGIPGDRLLLAAVHVLTTIGALVMLARPDPLRDGLLLMRSTQAVALSALVCAMVSLIRVRTTRLLHLKYVFLAGAVALSLAVMIFGSGPGTSGAKVNLGPVQPVELIRLLLVLFLATYLGRRWELIRQVRETDWRGHTVPGWLHIPRLQHIAPIGGAVGVALLLFFGLRDLGPALLLSLMFLALLAVARAGLMEMVLGIGILVAGFAVGYRLGISETLTARVAMWRAPWENAVRGGDQVAQALWALATGGVSGTGLGLGDIRYIPAGHTDLVLAGVGEELGAMGLLVAALAASVIAWRGLQTARRAPTDTTFFLAVAMTLTLVVPMLVMAAGILGLIPLTGVVTPFMSYGGSAMVVNFAALGLLTAIRSHGGAAIDARPFTVPVRWLAAGLAACALTLLAATARVQAFQADRLLVRPQLSLQADGGQRYQYNPRVLDAARSLPRGAIFDRRGVPLAASATVAKAREADLGRIGVSLREVCPGALERCYPLGPEAFHLIGNANTRLNWAASNTSYLERDAEPALRGFDDRALTVRTQDETGDSTLALKRDYRDLVPLVRHRWEPDHPAVKALRAGPRDTKVTIDARLQKQVSGLLARAAIEAGVQHAAAVVLDAGTGEILASVSYPWPSNAPGGSAGTADALLDRARYGLYPPGSTFKIVTAAAALRLDPSSAQVGFTCSRLDRHSVGARIPGWPGVIKDDVRDEHPHGTITMRDAIVHSCNAYFAQMAVRLGSEPLASTAGLAGLLFPTTGSPARVRENLPHSGYGQGDVLATPLRLARVASAIGSDGMIREPSLVQTATPVAPKPFLPAASARVLAGYLRDAVTSGTGQRLRGHAVPIAGKTGTAEVDEGRSHAWFVGFAPSGAATRRIAFAVILEHGGYGGAAAASVAGQIVTAASSMGLAQ